MHLLGDPHWRPCVRGRRCQRRTHFKNKRFDAVLDAGSVGQEQIAASCRDSFYVMPAAMDCVAELLSHPLCRPDDLGAPIPASPHAVSVCLPTWQDNVGYEEGDPRVVDRLRAGYPRFVYHPLCRQLFEACRSRFGRDGEQCLAFPTERSAGRFSQWMTRRSSIVPRIVPIAESGVQAAFFPASVASEAKGFWQHSGEGVTSRRAEATLATLLGEQSAAHVSRARSDANGTLDAGSAVRQRLADLIGVPAGDVYLFPCGMNAAWQLQLALLHPHPARRSVQFGFPYVDTLKIQQKLGPGAEFYPRGDSADLDALRLRMRSEPLSAVFTEIPSNPLLLSPDLGALQELCRKHGTILIIDDTIGSIVNVDAMPFADVLWMSLTKYFSGAGDVTGGAVALNARSPQYSALKEALSAVYENLLYDDDVRVLELNSRGFAPRMQKINVNAERLAEFLAEHPRVETVHSPKFRTPSAYDAVRRPGGGCGGLLSIDLKNAAACTPRFFDALRVCKGPNLGMEYTLACPYTILAHYGELDFAESCGVSQYLVRISVGTEDSDDLIDRFGEALARL